MDVLLAHRARILQNLVHSLNEVRGLGHARVVPRRLLVGHWLRVTLGFGLSLLLEGWIVHGLLLSEAGITEQGHAIRSLLRWVISLLGRLTVASLLLEPLKRINLALILHLLVVAGDQVGVRLLHVLIKLLRGNLRLSLLNVLVKRVLDSSEAEPPVEDSSTVFLIALSESRVLVKLGEDLV